jgi:hypothetical protein
VGHQVRVGRYLFKGTLERVDLYILTDIYEEPTASTVIVTTEALKCHESSVSIRLHGARVKSKLSFIRLVMK